MNDVEKTALIIPTQEELKKLEAARTLANLILKYADKMSKQNERKCG